MTTIAEGRRRPVSQADVAALAGVSVQTVSRVANGLNNVRPETRERILDAMRELDYRPNPAARALRSGRFNNLGVVLFDLSYFGSSHVLEAVTAASADAGYSLSLVKAEQSQEGAKAALARLRDQAVDGIVAIMEPRLPDGSSVPLPTDLPIVFVSGPAVPGASVVEVDQQAGAEAAVEHLLKLGHSNVWHLAGPEGSFSADERERGWRHALMACGLLAPDLFRGDWSVESGYRLGRYIAQKEEVTAVFAANDQMALGLLRACHEAGRSVPQSLSVVGFDNMAESAAFWPPLTTIEQPFKSIGEDSVDALVDAVQGTAKVQHKLLPPRIVLRDSAAPPAAIAHN